MVSRIAVIGVDLGTQATKAEIVAADGEPLASHQVSLTYESPRPGWAEQDPCVLEDSALAAIAAAVAQAPPDIAVAGISVAAQMGGAIGIDASFEPVTVHELWLDTRSDADRQAVLAVAGDRIVDANGIIPFVGPRARRWLREEPVLAGRLARVVAPGPYVVGRLTGAGVAAAYCDRTQANMYGCFDARGNRWDDGLAEAVGIPARLLPRLAEPTEVVGGLSPAAAARCGLPAGVPVAAGVGDGTGGWLAAGGIAPGACVDTGGSSAHFAITVDRFTPDPRRVLTCMPAAVPGLWYLLGFTTGTGLAHRWLSGLLAGGDYERLEDEAAALPPGAGALLCVAHLHGRVTPFEPAVKGAFVGFDEHTTPGHLYRAFMESVALEIGGWVDKARRLLPGLRMAAAASIGGGSQSRLWAQIKADVLGVPYVRLRPHVNAARGAALVAAAAVGAARLDEPAWHRPAAIAVDRREPDPASAAAYREMVELHRALLASLDPIYQRLAEIGRRRSAIDGQLTADGVVLRGTP